MKAARVALRSSPPVSQEPTLATFAASVFFRADDCEAGFLTSFPTASRVPDMRMKPAPNAGLKAECTTGVRPV